MTPMRRGIQTFQVGVKAFVWHDDRLLLVQEANAAARWELPGGRIDVGEELLPLADVLRRELREELGPEFTCTIGGPCATWVRGTEPQRTLPVFLVGLRCAAPRGRIVLSDEHIDVRWAGRDEWATLPLATGYAEAPRNFAALPT